MPSKIERLRARINELSLSCELEVDGGIDPQIAPQVVTAGATVLVAGTAIFGRKEGITTAMKALRASISHQKQR
jgi:ribulose-phosphate 3-epimerase